MFKSVIKNFKSELDQTVTVTEAMNLGFKSVVIFMDYSKAFNKVSHRALIKKLAAYGFDGKIDRLAK